MHIAVVGDLHGHLALMYAILGRWQREAGSCIDLILQVGDMGTYVSADRLDRATRRHAARDPEELGFAEFATATPPPTLMDPRPPLVFIPGNHEDFEYLDTCARRWATGPLYPVTPDRRVLALRSGRVWTFESGGDRVRVAGVSGISTRPFKKGRDPRLFLREADGLRLAELGRGAVDILISHERPAELWPDAIGSQVLRLVIAEAQPSLAFFGHYNRGGDWRIGPTRVIGLGDCGYGRFEPFPVDLDGIALLRWEQGAIDVERLCPDWLRSATRTTWKRWSVPET